MERLKEIAAILEMAEPVNAGEGVVIDTKDAVLIYSDGQFSDQGIDIYLHPDHGFIQYEWSRWQGAGSYWRQLSTGDVLKHLLSLYDAEHFDRMVSGLRNALI